MKNLFNINSVSRILITVFFSIFAINSVYSQWVPTNQGKLSNLGTYPIISVVNGNVIFIGGGSSNNKAYMYKSTNGGLNFSSNLVSSKNNNCYSLYATDENTIYYGEGGNNANVTKNANVNKSTDGGNTWTTILTTGSEKGLINGIKFSKINTQVGIVVSDPKDLSSSFKVWKTTNGGTNWILYNVSQPANNKTHGAIYGTFVNNANFFGFGVSEAPPRYCVTTNGGSNWSYVTLTCLPQTFQYVSTIAFSDNNLFGLAATSSNNNTVARTTDGGITWKAQIIPTTLTNAWSSIKWVPGTPTVYAIFSTPNSVEGFRSDDNGSTWITSTFPSATKDIKDFDAYYMSGGLAPSNAFMYSSSVDGTTLKLQDSPMPVKLQSFTYSVTGRKINLIWITSSEENNAGFEIYRIDASKNSNDPGNWINAGFVQGKGNTNNTTEYNFSDSKLSAGKYNYKIKQIDYNGNFEYFALEGSVEIGTPSKYNLSQNYPNPFNPTTKIDYEIQQDSRVSLKIYDISGKEVMSLVNQNQTAGFYTVNVNASNLSSGNYFYKLTMTVNGQDLVITKKMSLVK